MAETERSVRQSVSIPSGVARRVRALAKTRKTSANRVLLDQIDEHAVGARLSRLGKRAHAPGDSARNGHALTNRSLCFGHIAILHHCAPACTISKLTRGPLLVKAPALGTAATSCRPM